MSQQERYIAQIEQIAHEALIKTGAIVQCECGEHYRRANKDAAEGKAYRSVVIACREGKIEHSVGDCCDGIYDKLESLDLAGCPRTQRMRATR